MPSPAPPRLLVLLILICQTALAPAHTARYGRTGYSAATSAHCSLTKGRNGPAWFASTPRAAR